MYFCNGKINKFMRLQRLFSFSTLLLATVSSSYSQCIVAGTDFDTNAKLCCPILTSDAEEGGWYNDGLDVTELCNTDMFASFKTAKQKGIGGIFSTESSDDISKADDVFHLNALQANGEKTQYGYSTVTAQPKLIHPFCKANEESNNMYVNLGSAYQCPFLSYTVYGLTPGSSVELSFNVYNLLDPTYFDHLANVQKVASISEYITKYNYSSAGKINGNALGFGVASSDDNVEFNTSYNNALMAISLKKATTVTVGYGESTTVTHKATVPENGNITFYFYRTSDCFQIPVGIDDIKVTGEVSPIIVPAKVTPCPMQPLLLTSRQNYPEGTKFSWKESVTNQTSSDASFKFIPDAAETDYSVTLEVTLPGCKASKSEALNLHSGTCCTSADGAPMAMAYLFYDDFGNFISDDLYEWTDRFGETHTETIPAGQTHTSQSHNTDIKIPYVKAYNIENSGATLAVPMAGGTKSELYNHGVYVVSKYGGYPGGVAYDNSGTKTGGMLQFDLLEDGTQDEFFEVDIEHICTGKEISFGADFASMSEHPGCIEVSLEYNGNVLASNHKSFNGGSDGWQSVNEALIINSKDVDNASEVTLTMKIKHNPSCIPGGYVLGYGRDYAIDNIFISVCTPPDVALQYSINKGDLLELSTGDVFTLSAVTSDAVTKFYSYSNGQVDPSKKVGYVYQYTFQDPTTETETNKIEWKTIHKDEVVETDSFNVDIEKYWDGIFSKMEANDRIYFRVVVGEYSDLIADQTWKKHSALSSCRKVSISNIPVVAGVTKVESTTKPSITYTGTPCPEQPIRLTAKQSYPEGTKFLWKESVTGQTSTDTSFIFIPDAANTDYSVTLEVTAPGLSAAKSDVLTIHSENCCENADGAPMSMTYLFFDDFGNFTSDSTYEWKDKYGMTHTEQIPAGHSHIAQSVSLSDKTPCVRAYNIESTGATLHMPYLKDAGIDKDIYNLGMYAVSAHGAYPSGIAYDNSGTKTGGMLQFDLLDDGSQDEFFEVDIDNICVGKAVSFGVDFSSISEHPGAIEVSFEYNGKVLASEYKSVNGGSDGWRCIDKVFTLNSEDVNGESEVTLTMKMKHDTAHVPTSAVMGVGRDYAIDNIFVKVCTPPDVNLESSVNTGKNLLDLCSGDVLTLSSVTSDAVKKFYLYSNGRFDSNKKLGYVYQYTFQDPSTENEINKIEWKTIHKDEVVETDSFDVDVEEYFTSLHNDTANRIYFRVVTGEYSELIADQSWKKQSASSSCRNVSISLVPVVAGLNCVITCKDIKNTVDNTNKIEYYKKDAKKDSLKSLDQQNEDVFKSALASSVYTLKIGIVEDATDATAPDLKNAKLGKASSTIPVPTVKNVDSKDDEYLWYYTYLESANGCMSDTVLVGVVINGEQTSLTNTLAKTVSITPNPASTKISVIAEEVVEKVEILNMVGEVVKVSNRKDIDTSTLSNGVYFVRTTINDETTVHKLVINK